MLIAVFVVFAIVSSIGRRRQWLGATIVVLIVSSGVAALFFDTDRMLAIPGLLQEVVAGKETSDASVNYRVEFYAGGLKSIGDSPIVGHGWWHRFEAASRYMAPEAAATGLGDRSAHLHNDILNFGAGAGILGILAYFLLLAAPLAGAWFSAHDSQRKARLYAGSVLSLGFLAMGLTDSMFVYELPKTVFCLSAAVVLGFCRDSGPSSVPLLARIGTFGKSLRVLPPWTVLVFILVVPCLLGSLSGVVAAAAALIFAIPALRRPGAWDDLRWQPAMIMFVAAFAVLTAIFAITARQPADMGFSLNFIGVLLAPVVYLMAREKPADDARDLLIFCLAGAGAAALLAVGGLAMLSEARATGYFGGPNLFPRLAIPLGFVAMGGALLLPGRSRMIFYLGPIFALVAGLLSGSRGAVLALAPLALLAIAALAIRRQTRRDLVVFGGLAIVAVVGVVLLSPDVTERAADGGVEHRRRLWRHRQPRRRNLRAPDPSRRRVVVVPQLTLDWIWLGQPQLRRGGRRSGASRTARGPRLHVPQRRARLRCRCRRLRGRGLSRAARGADRWRTRCAARRPQDGARSTEHWS